MSVADRLSGSVGFESLRDGRALAARFLIGALVFAIILPMYWTFAVSVRSRGQIFAGQRNLLLDVTSLNWDNYATILLDQGYLDFVVNSLIIATGNTVLVMVLAVPAAYAFRLGLRGSKDIFFWILTNRMAPPVVFLLPVFFLVSGLGLSGTYIGLILVYCLFNLPFAIWLLHGIMKGIPARSTRPSTSTAATTSTSCWRSSSRCPSPASPSGRCSSGCSPGTTTCSPSC